MAWPPEDPELARFQGPHVAVDGVITCLIEEEGTVKQGQGIARID